MVVKVLLLVALSGTASWCQGLPSQLEFGGFQLGQMRSVTEMKFGKPFDVRTTPDGWLIQAFWTSPAKEHLLIFEYAAPDQNRIASIQLYGKATPGDAWLGGISLGATEAEVLKALGTPANRTTYMDDGVEFTKLEFADRNFSLELNQQGVVVSIKLIGFSGFPAKPAALPTTAPLRLALKNRDRGSLTSLLAPDFEIYRQGKTLSYRGPATEDIVSNKDLEDALFGKDGLREALGTSASGEEPQIRLSAKAVYHVVKYPVTSRLQEIVYRIHAGAWRIYEIKFRD